MREEGSPRGEGRKGLQVENSQRPVAFSATQDRLGRMVGDVPEYATPDRSGLESGFYVGDRGLPWHVAMSRRLDLPELMQSVDGVLSDEEALIAAGLAFQVERMPLSITVGKDKYRHPIRKEVPGFFANVRMDTLEALGVVKGTYKVIQQETLARLGSDIVDASGAKWETGGSLYGGRWVFLSMELPDGIEVEGDPSEYRLFLLLSNGHDGRHPLSASITVERAVCRNTLKIGEATALTRWVARHTSGVEGKVQGIREALGLTFQKVEDWNKSANLMVEKTLVDRQVEKILEDLFPIPERDQDRPERVPLTTFGKVLEIYQTSPSIDPIRGTAYGVLNAVTEYLDHVQVYRGRKTDASDVKADSLLFGGPSEIKKAQAVKVLAGISRE